LILFDLLICALKSETATSVFLTAG